MKQASSDGSMRALDRQVVELLAVDQCDAQFFLLRRVNQHSLHGPFSLRSGAVSTAAVVLSGLRPARWPVPGAGVQNQQGGTGGELDEGSVESHLRGFVPGGVDAGGA
jgi:hypothetical protein